MSDIDPNILVLNERIEELEAKLAKAVEALRGSRETILELVNSRWSETEGTDQDWVGDIDTTLAELRSDLPVDETRESQKGDSDD